MISGFAVKYVEIIVARPGPPPSHGIPIAEYMKRRERDPIRASALARARMRLSKKIDDSAKFSLTALRLSKGISQSTLAELIDSHQPYIARIEKGEVDVMFSTIEKLANALAVSIGVVSEAVQATRNARTILNTKNV